MTSSDTYEQSAAISIGEVARLAGVTVGTVRNWDRDGKLRSFRTPGNQRRFVLADVRAFLRGEA